MSGATLSTPSPAAPAMVISVFDVHVPDMYVIGFHPDVATSR